MKRNPGFLLIELIIGLALAATISLLLAGTLFRTNRARMRVDEQMDIYAHAALVQHQLERDLTTAFDPEVHMVPTESPQEPTAGTSTSEQNKETKSESLSDLSAVALAKEESPEKSLTQKIFYATNNGDNLDLITCITTSPLATYWGAQTGAAKASVARVVYRLVKDPEHTNAFMLTRQEGQDLNFASYENTSNNAPRAYTIAKNIKSCTCTYEVGLESTPTSSSPATTPDKTPAVSGVALRSVNTAKAVKDAEAKSQEQAPVIEYRTFPDWTHAESQSANTAPSSLFALRAMPDASLTATPDTAKAVEKTEPLPRIPHRITVTLTLWHPQQLRESTFTFIYEPIQSAIPKRNKPAATTPETTPAPTSPVTTISRTTTTTVTNQMHHHTASPVFSATMRTTSLTPTRT